MSGTAVQQLDVFGPDHCEPMGLKDARAWCRQLVHEQYENFSVLSSLVPHELRDDFAAVYAFCRWADDLGDEAGSPQRSLELLSWWRDELDCCYRGEPRHPVFTALAETIDRHDLPRKPFEDLIGAFEQDQTVTRYDSWDQLLGYCRGSADPVGRLVLMLMGEPRTEQMFTPSDRICTALQLTNHWQDVCRDILERDRIYLPRELIEIDDFEQRLIGSARQRYAVDQEFLGESRKLIKACVDRTWTLFEQGEPLLERVQRDHRPIISLFTLGGQHVLRRIESWNYETVLHRPELGKTTKVLLVAQAWVGRWLAVRKNGQGTAR
jgi:squalene synthase HpnC